MEKTSDLSFGAGIHARRNAHASFPASNTNTSSKTNPSCPTSKADTNTSAQV
jgi:hypothetical protein